MPSASAVRPKLFHGALLRKSRGFFVPGTVATHLALSPGIFVRRNKRGPLRHSAAARQCLRGTLLRRNRDFRCTRTAVLPPLPGILPRKSKSFRPRRDPARSGGGRRRKKPGKALAAPMPRRVLRGLRHGERGKARGARSAAVQKGCVCRRQCGAADGERPGFPCPGRAGRSLPAFAVRVRLACRPAHPAAAPAAAFLSPYMNAAARDKLLPCAAPQKKRPAPLRRGRSPHPQRTGQGPDGPVLCLICKN